MLDPPGSSCSTFEKKAKSAEPGNSSCLQRVRAPRPGEATKEPSDFRKGLEKSFFINSALTGQAGHTHTLGPRESCLRGLERPVGRAVLLLRGWKVLKFLWICCCAKRREGGPPGHLQKMARERRVSRGRPGAEATPGARRKPPARHRNREPNPGDWIGQTLASRCGPDSTLNTETAEAPLAGACLLLGTII